RGTRPAHRTRAGHGRCGATRCRAGARWRRGTALSRVCKPRYVSQLRGPRRSVHPRGPPATGSDHVMSLSSALGRMSPRRANGSAEASRAVNRLMRPAETTRELDPLVVWPVMTLLLVG